MKHSARLVNNQSKSRVIKKASNKKNQADRQAIKKPSKQKSKQVLLNFRYILLIWMASFPRLPSPWQLPLFVRCDQRSEVTADYDFMWLKNILDVRARARTRACVCVWRRKDAVSQSCQVRLIWNLVETSRYVLKILLFVYIL